MHLSCALGLRFVAQRLSATARLQTGPERRGQRINWDARRHPQGWGILLGAMLPLWPESPSPRRTASDPLVLASRPTWWAVRYTYSAGADRTATDYHTPYGRAQRALEVAEASSASVRKQRRQWHRLQLVCKIFVVLDHVLALAWAVRAVLGSFSEANKILSCIRPAQALK